MAVVWLVVVAAVVVVVVVVVRALLVTMGVLSFFYSIFLFSFQLPVFAGFCGCVALK